MFSRFTHVGACTRIPFFLKGWVIAHCMHSPHFMYPFTPWWPLGLPPPPGHCEQCCSERLHVLCFRLIKRHLYLVSQGALSSPSPKFNFFISSQFCFIIDSRSPFPLTPGIWKPPPLLLRMAPERSRVSGSPVPAAPPLTAPRQAVCTPHLDPFTHLWWVWLRPVWTVSTLSSTCYLSEAGSGRFQTWRRAHCSGTFVTKVHRHLLEWNGNVLHAQCTVTIWLCRIT